VSISQTHSKTIDYAIESAKWNPHREHSGVGFARVRMHSGSERRVFCILSECIYAEAHSTYINVDSRGGKNLARWIISGNVAVELFLALVPFDCVELVVFGVELALEFDGLAHRHSTRRNHLHVLQPAHFCNKFHFISPATTRSFMSQKARVSSEFNYLGVHATRYTPRERINSH
jgi:hypothetical protein